MLSNMRCNITACYFCLIIHFHCGISSLTGAGTHANVMLVMVARFLAAFAFLLSPSNKNLHTCGWMHQTSVFAAVFLLVCIHLNEYQYTARIK